MACCNVFNWLGGEDSSYANYPIHFPSSSSSIDPTGGQTKQVVAIDKKPPQTIVEDNYKVVHPPINEFKTKFTEFTKGKLCMTPDLAGEFARLKFGLSPTNEDIRKLADANAKREVEMSQIELWIEQLKEHTTVGDDDEMSALIQFFRSFDTTRTGCLPASVICNILSQYGEGLDRAELEAVASNLMGATSLNSLVNYSEFCTIMDTEGGGVSRGELIHWLRDEFSLSIERIEECGTGLAYLMILDKIFPGKVPMKRMKIGPKQEWEFMHNLKLVQSVFMDCKVPKNIEIERLAKCQYLDNLELMQWLRRFYDRKMNGTSSSSQQLNDSTTNSTGTQANKSFSASPTHQPTHHSPTNSRQSSTQRHTGNGAANLSTTVGGSTFSTGGFAKSARSSSYNRPPPATVLKGPTPKRIVSSRKEDSAAAAETAQLKVQLEAALKEIEELKGECESTRRECQFYYGKLRKLEVMSNQNDRKKFDISEVEDVLFTEKDLMQEIEEEAMFSEVEGASPKSASDGLHGVDMALVSTTS